jgi:hypothetical protein
MVRKAAPIELEDDDGALVAKLMQGGISDLGVKDGAQAAEFVANWLPLKVGVPISAGTEKLLSDTKEAEYTQIYGSLDKLAYGGRGVKARLNELRSGWKGKAGEAAISGGGALAGAALLGTLASGPVGWALGAAGMFAGGAVGNTAYNKAFNKQAQDPLILGKKVAKLTAKHQFVPPELVFATLAADLPDALIGRKIDNILQKRANTRLFHQAISTPEGMEAISSLMKDSRIDKYIRANLLLPFDPTDPNKTAVEQLTELLNNRVITARDLLQPSIATMNAVSTQAARKLAGLTQTAPGVVRTQSVNPALKSGIAISADAITHLPFPQGPHGIFRR